MPNPASPAQEPQPPLDPRVAIQRRLQGDQGSAEQFVIGNARPINKEVGGIDFGGEARREKKGLERLAFWRKTETVGVPAGAIARESLGGPGTIQNRENQRKAESLRTRLVELREQIPDLTQEQLDRMTPQEIEEIRRKREQYMQLHEAHRVMTEFQTAAASLGELERAQRLLENPNITAEERTILLQKQAAHLATAHWGITRYQQRYEIGGPSFAEARNQVSSGTQRLEDTAWYQSVVQKVALEYGMNEQSNIVKQAARSIFDKEQQPNTSMGAALGEVEAAMLGAPRPELRVKMTKQELAMQQTVLANLRNNHFVFRVLQNESGPQAALNEYEKYLAMQRAQFVSEARRGISNEVNAIAPERRSPTLQGLVRSVETAHDEYRVIEQTINPALREATRQQEDAEREYNAAHQEANELRSDKAAAEDELQDLETQRRDANPVVKFHEDEEKLRSDVRQLAFRVRFDNLNRFLTQGEFNRMCTALGGLSSSDNLNARSVREAGITSSSIGIVTESFRSTVTPEVSGITTTLVTLRTDIQTLENQLLVLQNNGTVLESDRELLRLENELIQQINDLENLLEQAENGSVQLEQSLVDLATAVRSNDEQDIRNAVVDVLATRDSLRNVWQNARRAINPGGAGNRYGGRQREISDSRGELEAYAANPNIVQERNDRKSGYQYALSAQAASHIRSLQGEIRQTNGALSRAEQEETAARGELDQIRTESAQEAARKVSREILGAQVGNDHELVRGLERELASDFRNPRNADRRLAWYKILNFLDHAFTTEIATPYTPTTPAQQPPRRRFQGASADADRDNNTAPRRDATLTARGGGRTPRGAGAPGPSPRPRGAQGGRGSGRGRRGGGTNF